MDKTLDLDELERVAREATPGEWVSFDRDTASNIYSAGNNGSLLAVCHSYTTDISEKRPNAARRKANATYIATFDPPTILTLIAAARPAGINTPDMPGQFEGDIWFGDPVKRNLGTHRWENGEWVLLPSELESVLELLAVRTAQRDAALAAARPAETRDWSEFEDEIADAISDSMDMDWSSRDGARAVVAYLKQIGAKLP